MTAANKEAMQKHARRNRAWLAEMRRLVPKFTDSHPFRRYERRERFECMICGALVIDQMKHFRYHTRDNVTTTLKELFG